MRTPAFLLFFLIITSISFAATIYVPFEYPTIQAGIDASIDGDTVLIEDGTYTGEDNREIDFTGKEIVVSSENGAVNCIVDCEGLGRGFYFHSGETSSSVLEGIKIIGGFSETGGGICCNHAAPLIKNCIIEGNEAEDYGGGIYCYYADVVIDNCMITGNSAYWHGGGVHISYSDIYLQNSIINDNSAQFGGGAWLEASNSMIGLCDFSNNSAVWDGGGLMVGFDSALLVYNCTFEYNSAWRAGGIWSHKSDSEFQWCLIANNEADCGGGVFCGWDSETTFMKCTISENTAIADGGGMHFSYCNAVLVFCPIISYIIFM